MDKEDLVHDIAVFVKNLNLRMKTSRYKLEGIELNNLVEIYAYLEFIGCKVNIFLHDDHIDIFPLDDDNPNLTHIKMCFTSSYKLSDEDNIEYYLLMFVNSRYVDTSLKSNYKDRFRITSNDLLDKIKNIEKEIGLKWIKNSHTS